MFEHQKALAKVQALVNAKRAALEANGEDPTSDDNVKLLEHIEKKNAAIQRHTKTGEISIEMQEEITPAEEKEQYMFNELKFPNKGTTFYFLLLLFVLFCFFVVLIVVLVIA